MAENAEYPRIVMAQTSTPTGRWSWVMFVAEKIVGDKSATFFADEAECMDDFIKAGYGTYPIYGLAN